MDHPGMISTTLYDRIYEVGCQGSDQFDYEMRIHDTTPEI